MSEYRPPLRDMKFVLKHIANVDSLIGLPDFDHVDTETAFAALDEAGRFFAEVVAPTNQTGDVVGPVRNDDGTVTTPPGFKEAYRQYVAAGWGALRGPLEYGGHGFPNAVGTAIHEMLTTANMALSLCPMLTGSALVAFIKNGTDEQRATYLEKLLTGQWSGTMLLTEPEAGSDLGLLRTKAEPNGDGTWAITGEKIFITWGEHDMAENIIHLVLARAPGAPPGTRGISMYIVPKHLVNNDGSIGERNNIQCISIEHKVGIKASPTAVMSMENATAYLIGEVHQGMRYMFSMMNEARLHVGLQGLAISERAYQAALAHAMERRQGRTVGGPKNETAVIVDHPDVRRMLMTMKANIEAMRGVMYDNATAIDYADHGATEGQRAEGEARAALLTPITKGWGTDLGVELTSIAIQLYGGMGYIEETGVAQHWRDSRIAPIYEGTNGIQAIDLVMRKLRMDGGAVVGRYIDEMEAFVSELEASGDETPILAGALKSGVDTLRSATAYLTATDDPNDALAGATPYMKMFGIVAGGYYLARMALVARHGAAGDEWLAAKIDTANFYAGQIMPQADGLQAAVTAGADQLFAVESDLLGP